MTTQVKSVYYSYFTDYSIVVIQNINLGVNGLMSQLLENKVIDDECADNITRLGMNDQQGRATKLITYLLQENNIDKYEGFLSVWATKEVENADELRTKIHTAIKNQGMKVPERWARPATASASLQPIAVVSANNVSTNPSPLLQGKVSETRKALAWQKSWRSQLDENTEDLVKFISLDEGSTVVLNRLLARGVLSNEEKCAINSYRNSIEKNKAFIAILGNKSEDNVKETVSAFRPEQDPLANTLQSMLDQALEDVPKYL